jgi:ubiquinone biosynthesis protein
MMARDPRLPLELRERLMTLESLTPSRREDGGLDGYKELFGDLEPLALGSVARVYRFWSPQRERWGVIKLLRIGVQQRVEEEARLWEGLASHLEESGAALGLPALNYRQLSERLTRLLRSELDPSQEQLNLTRARAQYRNDRRVAIPKVWNESTQECTVMEELKTREIKPEEGRLVHRILMTAPWFCGGNSLFHGDAHGGNVRVTSDGRLALLDWGSAFVLPKSFREDLTAAAAAGRSRNRSEWFAAVSRLTGKTPNQDAHPPGGTSLRELLETSAWGPSPPVSLLLLRKLVHHLEGFGDGLDLEVAAAGLTQIWLESPLRLLSWPWERGFSSHLSNAQLIGMALAQA